MYFWRPPNPNDLNHLRSCAVIAHIFQSTHLILLIVWLVTAGLPRQKVSFQLVKTRLLHICQLPYLSTSSARFYLIIECMRKKVFALSNLLFQKMKTCMRKFHAVSFMLFRCNMRQYQRRLTSQVLSVTFESRLGL